jgi:UDPglucose 6-dehydrogenase
LCFNGAKYCRNSYEAAKNSEAIIILTEWNEFREVDFEKIKMTAHNPLIIDGRNIFDPKVLKELGIKYYGVGIKE